MARKKTNENLKEKFSRMNSVMTDDTAIDNDKYQIVNLPFSLLEPNEHNKKRYTTFDVDEKKESIKYKGITTPLLIRPHPDKKGIYRIIDGETRWRAVQELNKEINYDIPLPCMIREDIQTEEEEISLSIIANIQRPKSEQDRNNEVADLVKALTEEAKRNPNILDGLTPNEKAAKMLNVSVSTIKRDIRANSLVSELKEEIKKGNISQIAASNLSEVPEDVQRQLVAIIQEKAVNNEKMSREETAKIKNEYKEKEKDYQQKLEQIEAEKKKIQREASEASRRAEQLENALSNEKKKQESLPDLTAAVESKKIKDLEEKLKESREREKAVMQELEVKKLLITEMQEKPKADIEALQKTSEVKSILENTQNQIAVLKNSLLKLSSPSYTEIIEENEKDELKKNLQSIINLL